MTVGRMLLLVLVGVAGCGDRAARTPRSPLPAGEQPRVAVLPFARGVLEQTGAFRAATTASDVPPEAGAEVARQLSAALAQAGIPVADADRVLGAASMSSTGTYDTEFARHVGDKVGANLAVLGAVTLYRQRRGNAWAVESPAGVDFQAVLLRASDGGVVTHVRFAYTQQSLTENLLDLPKFIQARGRWMTREEILAGGVDDAAARLAAAIRGEPAPRRLRSHVSGGH
jgi:hypothetical protein